MGTVLVIGGAEEKSPNGSVLGRFIQLAQGRPIGVLTGASQDPVASYQCYQEVFEPFSDTVHLDIRQNSERWDTVLERLGALFITGGDQGRLARAIHSTPLWAAIRRRAAEDLVVAGTSAGAAVLSDQMIQGGDPQEPWTSDRVVQWGQGLGILPGVIVDQHFTQRGRHSRLINAIWRYPQCIGLGVDEDTAVEIPAEGGYARVFGRGTATVLRRREGESDAFFLDVAQGGEKWPWPFS